MSDKESDRVGNYWSTVTSCVDAAGAPKIVRWWQHPSILRHINQTVCGKPLNGFSAGLNERCRRLLGDRPPLERGISIGGGTGAKEMALLQAGIVKRFDVFELAETRIQAGRELAIRQGLDRQIVFVRADAFEAVDPRASYDLVHWNNALHHMLDVEQAISWSWETLAQGGLFYMDDFVGPTRFCWPAEMLLVASAVRHSVPERLLRHPTKPEGLLSRVLKAADPEKLRQIDPSEAADSGRILECLKRIIPKVEVTLTGGVVYHLALSDMLANFTEDDELLLQHLLALDDQCVAAGLTHYAVASAIKE